MHILPTIFIFKHCGRGWGETVQGGLLLNISLSIFSWRKKIVKEAVF